MLTTHSNWIESNWYPQIGEYVMQLMSSDFSPGGAIPSRFTCQGDDVSPEFSWREAPPETKTFALIIHDPDAPRRGGFTHWVLYDIPADKGHLDPEVPNLGHVPGTGTQGRNDNGQIGYMGPCPPSGVHHYFARLFALDKQLGLGPGATHDELTEAMEGHILARAEVMGTYQKKAGRAA
jgi:Raf kinase inhibitor-like YbhB/YbcL family protein